MAMHARPQAETSHSDLPDLREASTEARAQAATALARHIGSCGASSREGRSTSLFLSFNQRM
jgi:hypothetical protein